MRTRIAIATLTLLTVSTAPSLASFSGKPQDDMKPSSSSTSASTTGEGRSAREEAERWYGDAYDDVAKANQALANGKAKDAEKRFKRAIERGERAVGLDSTYYEAFNLLGYCARNLKLYDRSLTAYRRCLALKPDYEPAHEYLGELYVETGELDKAKEELAWLQGQKDPANAKALQAKLDAALLAKGGTAAPPSGSTSAAPADSASSASTDKH